MHPMLNIATRAARRAGDIIVRSLEQRQHLRVESKGHNDFVSEVDRRAEAAIIETLLAAYPQHGFLGEESGQHSGSSPFVWIIDPLDGTTNFLHGHPQFAVSIALKNMELDRLEQAVIYQPLSQDLYTASRGQGAQLNNRRIRVSNVTQLSGALLGTGFPFRDDTYLEAYLATFRSLLPTCSGVRRCGSAALDLAFVAAGFLDGFWEFDLKSWDIAAGCLLIQEAGGMVTDLHGQGDYLRTGHVLAGNLKVHKHMFEILQNCLPSSVK